MYISIQTRFAPPRTVNDITASVDVMRRAAVTHEKNKKQLDRQ